MSENNIAPPRRRYIITEAILVSFIIYLVVGAFGMVVNRLDFAWAFVVGSVYFVTTLPFTFLSILVYRITKLPARFELLATILVVGIGVFTFSNNL